MMKRHSSFLIRCWEIRDGIQRIEIQHVQSGEKELVRSLAEAMRWISAHLEVIVATDTSTQPRGREDEKGD
jgi:hypothetical protein